MEPYDQTLEDDYFDYEPEEWAVPDSWPVDAAMFIIVIVAVAVLLWVGFW